MSKELVISSNRHETKVAVLEEDQLVEVYFQRSNEYSLAGSIHKGRVTRVLPGMQSAFVDLGLERDTFLYVSDFLEEHEDFDKITSDDRPVRPERSRDDRGRDRGRGDRGRDDRSREDRPRGPQAQPIPAADVPAHAGESAAESATGAQPVAVVASGTSAPAEGGAPAAGQDQRNRRGRRRRRRGSRGFPESKYAADGAPVANGTPQGAAPAVEEISPAEEADLEGEPDVDVEASGTESAAESTPIVLPGESLKKYRGPVVPPMHSEPRNGSAEPHTAAEAAAEVRAAQVDEDVDNEYDEPIHYPPENALPDAPVHETFAEESVAEEVVAEVAAAPVAEAKAEAPAAPPASHVVASYVHATSALRAEPVPETAGEQAPEHHEEIAQEAGAAAHEGAHEVEESGEEEMDEEPAVAPMLDEDEDLDIQAMILGDVEGIEIDESEIFAEESSGEATAEGAEKPIESGSAEVRERGGRFPHRVSRRTRRRGRGGDRGPGDRGEARGAEARGPENRGAESRGDAPRTQEGRESRPEGGRGDRNVSRPNTQQISISDLLKEGQEIIVQIAKEPLGQKGARITSHIALPGRYVVYMPTLEHMGVSRKIASDEERQRLKKVLQAKRPGPVGGFITRTAAEGRTEDEIAGDMQFLYNLWQGIKAKSEKHPAPLLLHHDLDIVQRILRDQLADNFKAIWIDNEVAYEGVLRFVEQFQPALVGKVKLYTREAPIFDAFNITSELEKALRPKVWLKSGGYIVINQTEALVAVDVNTGKFVGKSNRLEDTIVKTNTEAIKEIVRQIRLRDLGGIIVIDFIDMDERKNRQKVMQALEEAMRVDRAPYKILQFNDFGLVAITRKRVKQSLERTLCSLCPHCEGAGYIKSVQTVVSEILTEARKMAKSVEGKDVMLRVHPDVAKVLKSSQNKYLEELEEVLRRPVLVKGDAQLHHEKFDLA